MVVWDHFFLVDAFYVYVASLLAKDRSIKSQLQHFGQMLPDTFTRLFTHQGTMWLPSRCIEISSISYQILTRSGLPILHLMRFASGKILVDEKL